MPPGMFFLLLMCMLASGTTTVVQSRPSSLPTYSPQLDDFDGPTFVQWVMKQIATNHTQLGVAQGKYQLHPDPSTEPYFMLNYNVYAIRFNQVSDVTIWMDDVTLVLTDPRIAVMVFDTCANMTIIGLTHIHDKPVFSQAWVTDIKHTSADVFATMQVFPGYPAEYMLVAATQASITAYVVNNVTRMPYAPHMDSQVYVKESVPVNDDQTSFLWTIASSPLLGGSLHVGDLVSVLMEPGQSLYVAGYSQEIRFVNITSLTSSSNPFFTFGGHGGHVYDGVQIIPGPAPVPGGSPPLVSAVGGIMSTSSANAPTITRCLIWAGRDDAVNLQSTLATIVSVTQPGTLNLYSYGASHNLGEWLAGHFLRFYDAQYDVIGKAPIMSVQYDSTNPRALTVVVEKNASFVSSLKEGYLVTDMNMNNNNFVIVNNTFGPHRGRAMLIKGSNGVIAYNTINGSSLGGIHLDPQVHMNPDKPQSDLEADYSINVTIHNNYINNVAYYYGLGSIFVGPDLDNVFNMSKQYTPVAGGFLNITIRDNVIYNSVSNNIDVRSTMGLSIQNNIIIGPITQGFPAIYLHNDDSVLLRDNCLLNVTSPDPSMLYKFTNVTRSTDLEKGILLCNRTIPIFPPTPLNQ